MILNKNLQFLPNHYEIWLKLAVHELLILPKFLTDWIEIVDFLLFNSHRNTDRISMLIAYTIYIFGLVQFFITQSLVVPNFLMKSYKFCCYLCLKKLR